VGEGERNRDRSRDRSRERERSVKNSRERSVGSSRNYKYSDKGGKADSRKSSISKKEYPIISNSPREEMDRVPQDN
jgi:hypothetical protein